MNVAIVFKYAMISMDSIFRSWSKVNYQSQLFSKNIESIECFLNALNVTVITNNHPIILGDLVYFK